MTERNLNREIAAAEALKQSLATVLADDPVTMADVIEGGTNLHESIAVVMGEIAESEVIKRGLASMTEEYRARQERISNRIDRLRACVEQAMMVGEIKRLVLPDVTLTLRNNPPSVEIIDEAALPSDFWKARDPVIDKAAVREALKEGRAIPGAVMGNGSVSLQLRRT